jgi:protein SCO1/2
MFKYRFSKKAKRRAELRALQIVLALVLGLALAGVVVLWQINKDESRRIEIQREAQAAVAKPNLPPDTKMIGGAFTLTDQNGKTVTDADYRGKYLLVYFGYTYCPDMCPTGLQSIAHALDQLGADVKKVQPLLITIDPARDTPEKLKAYTASFHPEIIGLTGSAAQIAVVAKEYQVYYAKGEQVDEHDYMMDHSSLIYLMDGAGKFIAGFPENVDPAALVKALKEQWTGKTQ